MPSALHRRYVLHVGTITFGLTRAGKPKAIEKVTLWTQATKLIDMLAGEYDPESFSPGPSLEVHHHHCRCPTHTSQPTPTTHPRTADTAAIMHDISPTPLIPPLLWQPRGADTFTDQLFPKVDWEGGKEISGGKGGLLQMKVDELSIAMLVYIDEAGDERCMAATSLRDPLGGDSISGFKMLNERELKEDIPPGCSLPGGHLAQLLAQPRHKRPWLRGSRERVVCPSLTVHTSGL